MFRPKESRQEKRKKIRYAQKYSQKFFSSLRSDSFPFLYSSTTSFCTLSALSLHLSKFSTRFHAHSVFVVIILFLVLIIVIQKLSSDSLVQAFIQDFVTGGG